MSLVALPTFAIPSGTSIRAVDRDRWLAERAKGLGASEVADVCGFGYGSPLAVYLRKTGQLPPLAETEAMRVGTLCEPVVLALYQGRTGRSLRAEQVFVHRPEFPRLFATVDAVMEGLRPVEIKVVGHHAARDWGPEEDGADGVPYRVLLQATQQMMLCGAAHLDVAALLGTELRVYEVPFSEPVAGFLRAGAAAFLDRLDRRDPPPPGRADDADLIPYLHPGAEGEVELIGEAATAAERFLAVGDQARDLEAERQRLKARLDLAMAGAKLARLLDGRVLTRRVVQQEAGERVTRLEAKSWSVIQLKRGKGAERGDDE